MLSMELLEPLPALGGESQLTYGALGWLSEVRSSGPAGAYFFLLGHAPCLPY